MVTQSKKPKKRKKSGFGALKGMGSFTKEDKNGLKVGATISKTYFFTPIKTALPFIRPLFIILTFSPDSMMIL